MFMVLVFCLRRRNTKVVRAYKNFLIKSILSNIKYTVLTKILCGVFYEKYKHSDIFVMAVHANSKHGNLECISHKKIFTPPQKKKSEIAPVERVRCCGTFAISPRFLTDCERYLEIIMRGKAYHAYLEAMLL